MINPGWSAVNKVQQKRSSHDDDSEPDGLDSSASHCYDAWITYKENWEERTHLSSTMTEDLWRARAQSTAKIVILQNTMVNIRD